MNVKRNFSYRLLILLVVLVIALQMLGASVLSQGHDNITEGANQLVTAITEFTKDVKNDISGFINPEVLYPVPEALDDEQPISLIIEMSTPSVLDKYKAGNGGESIGEFMGTKGGLDAIANADIMRSSLITKLNKAGVNYKMGDTYDVVLSGFEIEIKAKDFASVNVAVGSYSNIIISEQYEQCETEVVTNTVNVYETGIFNSSGCGYDGTGMVVAVLDSGFDYTHTAYSIDNFDVDYSELGMNQEYIADKVGSTVAASITKGLSVDDVYYNDKIPYAYDYADGDPDVFPISSEHGTHVASIVAGKDDTITGVAPGAQLVLMKVFSDTATGARQSWLLSALEDCVILGVDVMNMSLGSDCGFARATDKDRTNELYDNIKIAGITLIASASNSYNSTMGSEKNGSLGLTSNPDSGTVGSPSTYDASLSIASISGVERAYLTYGDGDIMYYTEANKTGAEQKNFVDDILPNGVEEKEFDYVTIPGIGTSADYYGVDIEGKIALVRRGDTSFEEKANVAQAKGAAGILIYNNVSGDISMTVGHATLAVASISQDNGEVLADQGNGTITVSRKQLAGPFMSDFSSWGPGPNLSIKPEITAHGGDILAAVPGQDYDRLSGTSMSAPNQAGVTALVRQYIEEKHSTLATNTNEITALANQLMMSTTDIALNTTGIPYAVRKQGAGLTNLENILNTQAYLTVPSTADNAINGMLDKTKLELGDDPDKTGVYTSTFCINNIGGGALTYDVDAVVMTEGVSETETYKGETTVTQEGYILDGAKVVVTTVTNGNQKGNTVTVNAGEIATVTVVITLSDSDKEYLNDSFANGMYVEGFITLASKNEDGIDLSIPYLSFFGDWTQAPILDLDYFATDADDKDDSIDTLDKTLPDTFATTPIGGLSGDYISYLGSYYFTTAPGLRPITANRDFISLSNDENSINSIYGIYAGMIRSGKTVDITITDDATGEVIFAKTETNVRKSSGTSTVYPSMIDIDFDVADYNLPNNGQYTFSMTAYIDYGDGGAETNLNNTFEFPIVIDYQAPIIEDVVYTTEFDKTTKKTTTYAEISVFDNHYSMGVSLGAVKETDGKLSISSFSDYVTPIHSQFNSTSKVVIDITDYLDDMYSPDNMSKGTYLATVYDYAMNSCMFEIPLPTEVSDIELEDSVELNVNEIYHLLPTLTPSTALIDLINYESSDENVARVVDGTVVGLNAGTTTITATSPNGDVSTSMTVKVLGKDDSGYVEYDPTVASEFYLKGYTVDKAYYFSYSGDRDIGVTGEYSSFYNNSYRLEMFPSEAVTLDCVINAYYPEDTEIIYTSSNSSIVTIDENGKIIAQKEGNASVSAFVYLYESKTYFSQRVSISVKDPYVAAGSFLTSYMGLGGVVSIPSDLDLTEISTYAFSNHHSVPKDLTVDEITEEDPYFSKTEAIGEDTITKIIIPEGVETIQSYAFSKLTALEEVVLPSTLTFISAGAFEGCSNLKRVVGLENVKFINDNAFAGCALVSEDSKYNYEFKLDSTVAIGLEAFDGNNLTTITLPTTAQSIGIDAFINNSELETVNIKADQIKLGTGAFYGAEKLTTININAQVIPDDAFNGCTNLTNVTLGRAVATIGTDAFAGTNIATFNIARGNNHLFLSDSSRMLVKADGTLVYVAPKYSTADVTVAENIKTIGDNAFSSVSGIKTITFAGATTIGNYAFAGNTAIQSVKFNKSNVAIGDYAFYGCSALSNVNFENIGTIGSYAFGGEMNYVKASYETDDNFVWAFNDVYSPKFATADLTNVTAIGEGAFAYNVNLKTVTWPSDIAVPAKAFMACAQLSTFNNMENAGNIGDYAFAGVMVYVPETAKDAEFPTSSVATIQTALTEVNLGAVEVGNYAFANNSRIATANLSQVTSIGNYAFGGFVDGFDNSLTDGTPILVIKGAVTGGLTTVDLSSVETIGAGAFMANVGLKTVTGSENLKVIGDSAFAYTAINSIDLSSVTYIGNFAFRGNSLAWVNDEGNQITNLIKAFFEAKTLDLQSVEYVGTFAFAGATNLKTVDLGSNIETIGDFAFAGCNTVNSVAGTENASVIGDYAFAQTSITTADASNALYVGDYAFAETDVTTATLSENVKFIGENPFAACEIGAINVTNKEGNNFDFGSYSIIDGVLYGTTANGGLQLICYPIDLDATEYTVADNTVRIGSMAFVGSNLVEVTLNKELASVGHMAFFANDSLETVTFTSLYAPVLEEMFEEGRYTQENTLVAGDVKYYADLDDDGVYQVEIMENDGPIEYATWYMSETQAMYGANFVNYAVEGAELALVCPENGKGYDNWIWGRYFATTTTGEPAWASETTYAQTLINELPTLENLTYADYDQLQLAVNAYNAVAGADQLALIATEGAKLQALQGKMSVFYAEDVIGQLPTAGDVTLADTAAIVAARKAYNTAKQYGLDINAILVAKLEACESAIVTIVQEAVDKIPAVEDLYIADESIVKEARTAYNTAVAGGMVFDSAILNAIKAAEKQITSMKNGTIEEPSKEPTNPGPGEPGEPDDPNEPGEPTEPTGLSTVAIVLIVLGALVVVGGAVTAVIVVKKRK